MAKDKKGNKVSRGDSVLVEVNGKMVTATVKGIKDGGKLLRVSYDRKGVTKVAAVPSSKSRVVQMSEEDNSDYAQLAREIMQPSRKEDSEESAPKKRGRPKKVVGGIEGKVRVKKEDIPAIYQIENNVTDPSNFETVQKSPVFGDLTSGDTFSVQGANGYYRFMNVAHNVVTDRRWVNAYGPLNKAPSFLSIPADLIFKLSSKAPWNDKEEEKPKKKKKKKRKKVKDG